MVRKAAGMTVSVCTHVGQDASSIADLVIALRQSQRPPRELIVSNSGVERLDLPATSFPIRQIVLGDTDHTAATAGNAAAARARGNVLMFVDRAFVPHPSLIDECVAQMSDGDILAGSHAREPSVRPLLLQQFGNLETAGTRGRSKPSDLLQDDARNVHLSADSLQFLVISAPQFAQFGGFDARFALPQYAWLDFTRTALERGLSVRPMEIALTRRPSRQDNESPSDALESVLRDERLFESKWGETGASEWLRSYAAKGLIERSSDGWRGRQEAAPVDRAASARKSVSLATGVPSFSASLDDTLGLCETTPLPPGSGHPAA